MQPGIKAQFRQSNGTFSTLGKAGEVSEFIALNNAGHLSVQVSWGTLVTAGRVVITGSDDKDYAGSWATLMVMDFADDNGAPGTPVSAPKKTHQSLPADSGYSLIRVEVYSDLTATKTVEVTIFGLQ